MKKFLLILSVFTSIVIGSKAQLCGTDIMTKRLLEEHPEFAAKIEANKAALDKAIIEILKAQSKNPGAYAKTTAATDTTTIVVPVAVHVIHDYGTEDVTDNQINTMMKNLNDYYQLKNDVSGVIPPFVKYIGKANVAFRLATKDPSGNPTRGVTRRQSYLTNGGDNNAKFDLWAPASYLNIWVEKFIGTSIPGGTVAAYSQLPPVGAADPYIDGLITAAPYIDQAAESYVIAHEVGHYLNLLHPFGSNNTGTPANGCGDDEVDDTPPTSGEFNVFPCPLYDTFCATGYIKAYPSSIPGIDSIVDYPDTANVQNIMTYSNCNPELMFTKGQVARMRATLQADIAKRDSLSTPWNLYITGADQNLPILPPTADFSVEQGVTGIVKTTERSFFLCQYGNTQFSFKNQSWNDTITNVQWTLSNGGTPSSTTANAITASFQTPGWASVNLKVTGKSGGTDTITKMVYVADTAAVNPVGYFQEFNPNGDLAKWPIFNYYNNDFKWQVVNNAGYYDNTSIEYHAYDPRSFPANATGSSKGDYDDFFTPGFDLRGLGSNASLNFLYSGASRSGVSTDINDTLQISYSVDCGMTWKWGILPGTYLSKTQINNQGTYATEYAPTTYTQWSLQSIALPTAATSANKVYFRFRYRPGANGASYTTKSTGYSTSNNFYMDRINFSNFPLGMNTLLSSDKSVVVAPNPTSSNSYVIVSDENNTVANVQVTDITGKVVYTVTSQATGKYNKIEIPESVLRTSGFYLVHVSTPNQSRTEKLAVYK